MSIAKHLSLLLLLCAAILAGCSRHKQVQYVLDREQVLTPAQQQQLQQLYSDHEQKTTNEIVLITTPDYGVDSSIASFALHFFNTAGIGKKERNNGVLIAFCKARHSVNITTGYGTEKVLTDSIAFRIIRHVMTPCFRENKYFAGIWAGSKAITDFLERPENKIGKK